MNRLEQIRNHTTFKEQLKLIMQDEEDRIFCGHNMTHLLDVARIMTILAKEQALDISRELIYTVALLHDIGRHAEYAHGEPHDEAGARLAKEIMTDCAFSPREIEAASSAILKHRSEDNSENTLGTLLYNADKASRACYMCNAQPQCKWPKAKMNLRIEL